MSNSTLCSSISSWTYTPISYNINYLCPISTTYDNQFCYSIHCERIFLYFIFYYVIILESIPQASWPNLLQGLIIFLTFIYVLYHINITTKRALAGLKDQNILSFSVYIYFLQACSIWAVLWSIYRIFQTPDNDSSSHGAIWHGIAVSSMLSISEMIEFSVIIVMLMNSIGTGALYITAIITLGVGILCFICLMYVNLHYPGCNQLVDSDYTLYFLLCWDSISALFYIIIYVIYSLSRSKRLLYNYCAFLAAFDLFKIASHILLLHQMSFGICLYDIAYLIYFSGFALVLYDTLLKDSQYWTNIFTGGEATPLHPTSSLTHSDIPMSEYLIPSNQLLFMRLLNFGAGGIVDLHIWKGRLVVVKKLTLKMMTHSYLDSFAAEAGLLRELVHPNIVEFLGVFFDPPRLGIVMEYCAQGSLSDNFSKPNILFDMNPLKIAVDIASGMKYLHDRGFLHRDLKAANVLLTESCAKLADFGDTHPIFNSHVEEDEGNLHGTPGYMAPEILFDRQYTKGSDVYSFGILLWQLFTCKPPTFRVNLNEYNKNIKLRNVKVYSNGVEDQIDCEEKTDYLIIQDTVDIEIESLLIAESYSHYRPPTPIGLPIEMENLINSCLSEMPESRPSFSEILDFLEKFLAKSDKLISPSRYPFVY